MPRRGQSKMNNASSAAESAAAILPPPPAISRRSLQNHKETPSPVKQANSKEFKKKQASPIKKNKEHTEGGDRGGDIET
eukprot:5775133-Ditylum_brightwellii.AAC.1